LSAAESATTPMQDPHYIQARPSLIAKVRRAALVVCTGADLEIGWLPLLLRQSGNANVQPGQPGYMNAFEYVEMLDKPTIADRSRGDIHPFGNPHIQMDPRNIGIVAVALAERLTLLDPANADTYRGRYEDFAMRWQTAVDRWTAQIQPLDGMQVVTHHKGWVYLERWASLDEVGNLEPKPGIPPSAAHLATLLDTLAGPLPVQMFAPSTRTTRRQWLARRTEYRARRLTAYVGSAGADDLSACSADREIVAKRGSESRRCWSVDRGAGLLAGVLVLARTSRSRIGSRTGRTRPP
jgi:zinc/manganese transport system substrate-binding protein